MSLWGRSGAGREERDFSGITAADYITQRMVGRAGNVMVTPETALRHSAVWACCVLRADLVSTFPLDVYRKVGGLEIEASKPPILVDPGGAEWDYMDWMWATQFDLDRAGNAIGLVTETNALGLPARIDLQPIRSCSVVQPKGSTRIIYRIDGIEYPQSKVWHERQYRIPGLPVGLSPVAYAAWTIGEYLSIQEFALAWFAGGAVPKARMKNTATKLKDKQILDAKQWYRDTIQNGDLLVHGNDWEYSMIQAMGTDVVWLDARKLDLVDVCRFFGAPADLIDAAISGESITYANISQRNLQFLIMKLGVAVARRERTLNKLLPAPRFVKMDTDSLLRMDPASLATMIHEQIDARILTLTEAREQYNRPPLTDADIEMFNKVFPQKEAASKTEKVG